MAHLGWIPALALVGFLTAFVFGDLLTLPVDLYYFVYFCAVLGFLAVYVRRTRLNLRTWWARRWLPAVVLGALAGAVLVQGVLAQPGTPRLTGVMLWWAVLWRGLAYGAVDGVLLFGLPWVVTWRAFDAESGGFLRRAAAAAVAWIAILVVTTAYHLGYRDFRSPKVIQPNIGSTIAATATLLSANPIGSPLAHVMLHVAAVVHAPGTDLYLPPHRTPDAAR